MAGTQNSVPVMQLQIWKQIVQNFLAIQPSGAKSHWSNHKLSGAEMYIQAPFQVNNMKSTCKDRMFCSAVSDSI